MRALWLSGAVAACLCAVNAPVLACEGKTILFEDSFDSFEPTWGDPAQDVAVENGQFVLKPASKHFKWVPSHAAIYDDIDLCATVTTVAGIDPKDTFVGLAFWFQDNDNFYVFEIGPNGKASVWRRQRGKWLSQVNWQDFPAIKQGDGAVNQLRVVTNGSEASFYANGQPFKQIKGNPPKGGQQIAAFAASLADATAIYAFDNVKITRPESAKAASSK